MWGRMGCEREKNRHTSWIMTRSAWSKEWRRWDLGWRRRSAIRNDVFPSPAGTQKPPTERFLPPAVQQQIS
jgi:hypothetical protein